MRALKVLIIIGCAIFGYLCGSLPSGVIVSKLFFHKDPRSAGSGNTGATNVLRTVSKRAGVLVLALDMLKMIAPFIAIWAIFTHCAPAVEFMSGGDLSENAFGHGNTLCELTYYITALGCFIGHPFSCFLQFQGGKLVSCYIGFNIPISYYGVPFFAPFFLITFKKTRYVALSSLVLGLALCTWSWILYILYACLGDSGIYWVAFFGLGPNICIYFPVVSTIAFVIMVIRHKDNIIRMRNGTENKIEFHKNIVNEKHD